MESVHGKMWKGLGPWVVVSKGKPRNPPGRRLVRYLAWQLLGFDVLVAVGLLQHLACRERPLGLVEDKHDDYP